MGVRYFPPGATIEIGNGPRGVQLSAPGGPSNDFLNGLMAYWPGNEASGNAIDAHIHGFDLTDTNTVTTASGLVYAAARQFTAANSERLSRANEALLQGGDFDFTFATWFYADSYNGGTGRTIAQDAAGAYWLSLSNFVANRCSWTVYNTGATAFTVTYGTDIALSGWNLAIGWYRSSDKQVGLKINGNAAVTTTLTGTPRVAGTPDFEIGFSGARYFDGRISPAGFWRREFTDAEKTAYYNAGLGIAFANMRYLVQPQRDIFVIGGQSNASGRGTNNQVYSHASLIPLNFANDYRIKRLVDPYDINTNQVDTVSSDGGGAAAAGSWIPLLATQLMTETGRAPVFVPCAKGGVSITSWLPGADHADRSTLYGSMVYRARQAMAYGTLRCVLWWQGETDAEAGMSQATYNGHLDTIANAVMTDLGIPLMPCKLQNSSIITDANELAINAAIAEAWGDNANVLDGPDFSDITSDDDYHLKTNGNLQTAADRWFTAIDAAGIL